MTSFYEEIRKSDSIDDEKENAQSRANVDKWIFRLLLFLIGFMPLVVLANVEEVISPLISNLDILSSGLKGDLFTHYKALILVNITVVVTGMLLAKVLFMGGTLRKSVINYLLGIFVLIIVISTVMSPNITITLNGQYNRSDGAISWLCYVALMFVAMNIEYPKNVVRYIMYTMLPFVYINLYIITMNFLGNDVIQKVWVQKLISIALPEGAAISEGSELVGTLNQWNYMSGMFAMMTLMYLVFTIVAKKWADSVVAFFTSLASVSILFMSISTSGFLTFIVFIPFLVLLIFLVENRRKSTLVFVAFLLLSIPIFHTLAEKNSRVWTESFGFLITENPYVEEVSFSLTSENTVYASLNTFELPVLPERAWSLGTGRTYIWKQTLGLLEERPLIGYGSDTLMYNYPHFKLDSRSGMLDENTITDKAHNIYVGTGYGFGILGLIILLILLFKVGILTIKLIRNKVLKLLPLAILVLAYFVQGMFNDSLPSISTIPWIFMGIIFAIYMSKTEELINNGK